MFYAFFLNCCCCWLYVCKNEFILRMHIAHKFIKIYDFFYARSSSSVAIAIAATAACAKHNQSTWNLYLACKQTFVWKIYIIRNKRKKIRLVSLTLLLYFLLPVLFTFFCLLLLFVCSVFITVFFVVYNMMTSLKFFFLILFWSASYVQQYRKKI